MEQKCWLCRIYRKWKSLFQDEVMDMSGLFSMACSDHIALTVVPCLVFWGHTVAPVYSWPISEVNRKIGKILLFPAHEVNKIVWNVYMLLRVWCSPMGLLAFSSLSFLACRHEDNCQWSRTSSVVWRHSKGERRSGTSPDDYLQGWSIEAEEGEPPFKRGCGDAG